MPTLAPSSPPARSRRYRAAKRLLDAAAALVGLALAAPLLAALALWVKLDSPGPAFYRGVRVGLGARTFRIVKFRSMVLDADRIGGPTTSDDDPRVTRAGAFIRRFKLDELPQLVNVLLGEMSLVGPRPDVPSEVAKLTGEQRALICSVPPGMTDWASIRFHNEGEIVKGHADPHAAYERLIRPHKVALQAEYARRASFGEDLRILWTTFQTLAATRGQGRGEPPSPAAPLLGSVRATPGRRLAFFVAGDTLLLAATTYLAFLLRFEGAIPRELLDSVAFTTGLTVVATVGALAINGLYRVAWSRMGLRELLLVAYSAGFGSAVLAALNALWHGQGLLMGYPRSVILLQLPLAFLALAAFRLARRFEGQAARAGARPHPVPGRLDGVPVVESLQVGPDTPRSGASPAAAPASLAAGARWARAAGAIRLPAFARDRRRGVKFGMDLALWSLTIPLAFYLRLEGDWLQAPRSLLLFSALAVPVLAIVIREMGFHRQSWSETGVRDVMMLGSGVGLTTAALFLEAIVLQRWLPVPRSIPLISGFLALVALASLRFALRALRQVAARGAAGPTRRVVILGAGDAGNMVARELLRYPEHGIRAVAFLDDDPTKAGLEYNGIPVLGRLADLASVAAEVGADEALLAIPSAPLSLHREVSQLAREARIRLRFVPGVADLLEGRSGAKPVTDLALGSGRPRSVLVVGGAGYIGSALIAQLLRQGCNVRVLDLLVYGDGPLRPFLSDPRFELVRGDFRQLDKVVEAVQGMDAVVHLGALVGDPACALDDHLTIEINVLATKMVAEVAKGYGVSRFVFASSCSVYGASDAKLTEESGLNPVSLYARTKVASERILLRMAGERFAPIILRFATVHGLSGRTRFDLVVNLLTAKAVQDGVITLTGGDQWRPFLHVEDAAGAIVTALEAPAKVASGEIFNVGSDDQNFTLAQVAELIRAEVPTARVVEQGRDGDRRNYRVDFRKIRERLGFQPRWTVPQGIRQVADALREGRVKDYRDPVYSNVQSLRQEGISRLHRSERDDIEEILQPVAPV